MLLVVYCCLLASLVLFMFPGCGCYGVLIVGLVILMFGVLVFLCSCLLAI